MKKKDLENGMRVLLREDAEKNENQKLKDLGEFMWDVVIPSDCNIYLTQQDKYCKGEMLCINLSKYDENLKHINMAENDIVYVEKLVPKPSLVSTLVTMDRTEVWRESPGNDLIIISRMGNDIQARWEHNDALVREYHVEKIPDESWSTKKGMELALEKLFYPNGKGNDDESSLEPILDELDEGESNFFDDFFNELLKLQQSVNKI